MFGPDVDRAFREAYRAVEAAFLEPIQGAAERYIEREITWPSLYCDEGGEA